MTSSIKNKQRPAFGTKEWAGSNENFIQGCIHDCKYCFAKGNAVRFRRKTAENWRIEEVNFKKLKRGVRKRKGTIMFPSSHDISPKNVDYAIQHLEKLVKAGNNVLVVSKPHLEVIQKICSHFQPYKDQMLFRFTIGSDNTETLKFWEPNAPSFEERLSALQHAQAQGFKTSVSIEPALDGNTFELVQKLSPFVTDSLWIGLANRLKGNLKLNGHADDETWTKANELKAIQTKHWVEELADKLKDHPKIKWKDSCKKVLGIIRPIETGLDI